MQNRMDDIVMSGPTTIRMRRGYPASCLAADGAERDGDMRLMHG